MRDIEILITWTPYLLGGLGWNLIISVLATVMGTALGSAFVWMKFRKSALVRRAGDFVPALVRGAPTLFLLFYLAILIPNQLVLFGGAVTVDVPNWLKAAFALTASPFAFTAWNLHSSIIFWNSGRRVSAILFVPNWLNGFMITLLASSGASLVGVNELVGRTNTVIKTLDADYALILYCSAAGLFLAAALIITLLGGRVRKTLSSRLARAY